MIYDKCVRILGDPTEADDAVQETFVSAFKALHSFRYGDSHLPWLYRIATNTCLNIIRTRTRKGTVLAEEHDPEDTRRSDPTRALHMRRILNNLVSRLDDRTLSIMVAHYFDGMDQSEIARQLGISRRAVVKRLTALRTKVQSALEEGMPNG